MPWLDSLGIEESLKEKAGEVKTESKVGNSKMRTDEAGSKIGINQKEEAGRDRAPETGQAKRGPRRRKESRGRGKKN